jgi:hypothetical protein
MGLFAASIEREVAKRGLNRQIFPLKVLNIVE